ncbi:MAG: hypothetical protein L0Z73_08765 [Gammaproteobacteria bacterium]|nr:hypothetical protein [Gammaproteobacteria bacterium]
MSWYPSSYADKAATKAVTKAATQAATKTAAQDASKQPDDSAAYAILGAVRRWTKAAPIYVCLPRRPAP